MGLGWNNIEIVQLFVGLVFLKVVLENLASISISEAIHTILSSELEDSRQALRLLRQLTR